MIENPYDPPGWILITKESRRTRGTAPKTDMVRIWKPVIYQSSLYTHQEMPGDRKEIQVYQYCPNVWVWKYTEAVVLFDDISISGRKFLDCPYAVLCLIVSELYNIYGIKITPIEVRYHWDKLVVGDMVALQNAWGNQKDKEVKIKTPEVAKGVEAKDIIQIQGKTTENTKQTPKDINQVSRKTSAVTPVDTTLVKTIPIPISTSTPSIDVNQIITMARTNLQEKQNVDSVAFALPTETTRKQLQQHQLQAWHQSKRSHQLNMKHQKQPMESLKPPEPCRLHLQRGDNRKRKIQNFCLFLQIFQNTLSQVN
ncbi:hypothetical protein CHS0354_016301 [Potamilus streckersoni]|uniref:Uncharacterized protein n=1 Tax=Potamilus streckersoni TaxID=2493646 RepID=A0AAE0RM87_9BIVA|nr:hypothetical protein CHS0354_016301 [Potamilus streckersoni]